MCIGTLRRSLYSLHVPLLCLRPQKFPGYIKKALGLLGKRLEALETQVAAGKADPSKMDDWDALPLMLRQQHAFMGWLEVSLGL